MVQLRLISPPSEGVEHKQENTRVFVQNGCIGSGTLFIAHSALSWLNEENQGFSLKYPAISLHAISKDVSSFPHHCLYMMLDGSMASEFEEDKEAESDEDDDEDEVVQNESNSMREVRFVPSESTALETIYSALSACQKLHPDPEDSLSEGEGGGGDDDGYFENVPDDGLTNGQFFTDATGLEHLTAEGQQTLNHLMNVMEIQERQAVEDPQVGGRQTSGSGDAPREDNQFDDADDAEDMDNN